VRVSAVRMYARHSSSTYFRINQKTTDFKRLKKSIWIESAILAKSVQ